MLNSRAALREDSALIEKTAMNSLNFLSLRPFLKYILDFTSGQASYFSNTSIGGGKVNRPVVSIVCVLNFRGRRSPEGWKYSPIANRYWPEGKSGGVTSVWESKISSPGDQIVVG